MSAIYNLHKQHERFNIWFNIWFEDVKIDDDDDDDDDDGNDDDDDELFLWYGWLTKGLALFPAGTIARDPQRRESPTHREQDLNLRRTWVQALMNEVAQ